MPDMHMPIGWQPLNHSCQFECAYRHKVLSSGPEDPSLQGGTFNMALLTCKHAAIHVFAFLHTRHY